MKVAVFGGTGFVGNYLLDELIRQNHQPQVLVRPGSLAKLLQKDKCTTYEGDLENLNAVKAVISSAEAIIYNVGLIRQFPKENITFEKLHVEGVKLTISLAEELHVKRYILMSANGAKPNGTAYQKTKYIAEQILKNSTLDWTIFRPSLIFGDPRGTIEFCTQLRMDMLDLPFPAPLFYRGIFPKNAGNFSFSPVYVTDVAKCFVSALDDPATYGKFFELGGERTVSWKELIKAISLACGKNKWTVPVPAGPLIMLASLFDHYRWFPITADQLTMLLEGNCCTAENLRSFIHEPAPFESLHLSYL